VAKRQTAAALAPVEASFHPTGTGPLGLDVSESSGIVEAGLAAVIAFLTNRD
jgi:hypothetical protein